MDLSSILNMFQKATENPNVIIMNMENRRNDFNRFFADEPFLSEEEKAKFIETNNRMYDALENKVRADWLLMQEMNRLEEMLDAEIKKLIERLDNRSPVQPPSPIQAIAPNRSEDVDWASIVKAHMNNGD